MTLYLILLLVLALVGLASYAISNVVYKSLVRSGNNAAGLLRAITFVLSFLIILVGVVFLFLNNVRLER